MPIVKLIVMGMIRRTTITRIMLSLYKTLVRPHVEYCSCAWNPSYKKDKELLEKTQHRYTKMIINIREKTYKERLKLLGLWTLEERRNRQDIIEVYKMYRGYSSVALQELFETDTNSKGTRGHSCKLKGYCVVFFLNRGINRWNALDQSAVDAPSINAFKQKLVKVRNNRTDSFMD